MLIAYPPSYGDELERATASIINEIKRNPKTNIETMKINGNHHFHMTSPRSTAEVVLNFFRKIKTKI
jgi:hypothetical protein